MGRKKSAAVEEKRRAVKVRPIERKHRGKVVEAYRLLEDLIADYHAGEVPDANGAKVLRNLDQAKFLLAYRAGWKPDVDKVLILAKIHKASDREKYEYKLDLDFVIELNEEAWPKLSGAAQCQKMDHELYHAAPDLDRDGRQKIDSHERLCWRLRKHYFQEHREIIDRYGVEECLSQNEVAVQAAEDAERPLLAAVEKAGAAIGRPKRVRLMHDIKNFGAKDSEWEVHHGTETGVVVQVTAGGAVYTLKAGEYEVIDREPTDWRKLPIDTLKLTANVLAKCGEKDVQTLGDFQAFQAKHGDFWGKELGLHGNQAATVVAAFDVFWVEHPEYCQEKPAAA